MNPDRPPRVAIWCAVSSQPQADRVSLADQERQGREFAQAIGGDVVAVYMVPGHSRDLIFYTDAEAEMRAYRDLHHDVEAGHIDVLWGIDIDRLGRDPALSQQVISLVEKHAAEVYLASAPHTLGSKTVAHRYITAIQGVRASEEQAIRVRRQQMGMRDRVQQGLISGIAPLGYDPIRDPTTGRVTGYTLNDQAEVVRAITALFLAGHTYAEISRRLNASPHRPPRARRWGPTSIGFIMRNSTYAGRPHWGGCQPDEPSDLFPAIWDEATHAAILQEHQRRGKAPFVRHGAGPLTGVAYCARCGRRMYRVIQSSGVPHLRCQTQARQAVTGVPCHPNLISEHVAVQALWQALADMRADLPASVEHILNQIGSPQAIETARRDLRAAEHLVHDLERQRERLALALAGGALDAAMYRQTDDSLLTRLAAAQACAAELRQQYDALPDLDERRERMFDLVEHCDELFAGEPAAVAKRLQDAGLRLLIEEHQVVGLGWV